MEINTQKVSESPYLLLSRPHIVVTKRVNPSQFLSELTGRF